MGTSCKDVFTLDNRFILGLNDLRHFEFILAELVLVPLSKLINQSEDRNSFTDLKAPTFNLCLFTRPQLYVFDRCV